MTLSDPCKCGFWGCWAMKLIKTSRTLASIPSHGTTIKIATMKIRWNFWVTMKMRSLRQETSPWFHTTVAGSGDPNRRPYSTSGHRSSANFQSSTFTQSIMVCLIKPLVSKLAQCASLSYVRKPPILVCKEYHKKVFLAHDLKWYATKLSYEDLCMWNLWSKYF